MNKNTLIISIIFSIMLLSNGCFKKADPPLPYGALPSPRQLDWHQMEVYGFLHFTTNTFTDMEWGYGDETPAVFNPSAFDADQIIGTLAKAGFKGAILTAKHHDGFCLWPSEYTEHSVRNSPWKDGKGDVVRELSEACKKYGLKFGVYLSPWDRHHADYGEASYVEYYRNQLTELLTNYGEIFEVWFDGANGGDGYYGGAREERRIDRSTYYQWDKIIETVRRLQPDAVMFSDAGPDLRWVGNEKGYANDSCWATYTPLPRDGETRAVAGTTQYWLGETGMKNGDYWIPAETDVSIRPGWFYHASEDDQVKSLGHLLDIYYHSVGNGTSLLLNIPPDRTGQIHETDSIRLMEFKQYLEKAFDEDLLAGAQVVADHVRGNEFEAENVTDHDPSTYWATEDAVHSATIEFELNGPISFNCLVLQEYIALGQRVFAFVVKGMENDEWHEVARGSTIGYKKIIRFDPCTAERLSITFDALDCPVISDIRMYDTGEKVP